MDDIDERNEETLPAEDGGDDDDDKEDNDDTAAEDQEGEVSLGHESSRRAVYLTGKLSGKHEKQTIFFSSLCS